MKYIYLSIIGLLFLVLIPFSVQAKDIEVTNVEVLEKNHYVSEVSSPSINEDKVDFNLKFEDYEQYITYKITVNNNSYYDYTYEINKKDESIISYEILDEENKINYSSTKDIVLKIWYKEEINEELYNDNKYNIEDKIELKFSGPEITSVDTIEELKKAIENPETGAFFSIIIALIVLIISIIVYKKAKSLSKFKHFIWMILLVPVIVLASSNTISIYLNFNIELDKPTLAVFRNGWDVNAAMKNLAGISNPSTSTPCDNILAVKRSYERLEDGIEVQSNDFYMENPISKSDYKIYMWYDETNKTIYYYSDAIRVSYPSASNDFYAYLINLQEYDKTIKADAIMYTSGMFRYASLNLDSISLDLSGWKLKSYQSMSQMFQNFANNTKDIYVNANDWTFYDHNLTSYDKYITYVFQQLAFNSEKGKTNSIIIDSNNWTIYGENPTAREIYHRIGAFASNVTINAKNWNLPDINSIEELFYLTGDDVINNLTMNLSGLKAPKAKSGYKLFWNTGYGDSSAIAASWNNGAYANDRTKNGTLNVKIDVSNWDIGSIENLEMAFIGVCEYGKTLEITGLESWDTSNVTNMQEIFQYTGQHAEHTKLENIENWDVSKVTNISMGFECFATKSDVVSLDLSNWKLDSVENIGGIFSSTGNVSEAFYLNINNWKLPSNAYILGSTANNANNVVLDANNIDFSKTTSAAISGPFQFAKNVKINMDNAILPKNSYIMSSIAFDAENVEINFNNWDVSNVKNILASVGTNANNIDIKMNNWKLNNETNISQLFSNIGSLNIKLSIEAKDWDLGDATSLSKLFRSAAQKVHSLKLDLSGWDTSNITDMSEMFNYAFNNRYYTVTYDRPYAPPTYHYYEGDVEPTIEIIGIDKWDVSNVTNMEYMFGYSFKYFKNLKLDLSSWNISNLTNANYMFSSFGQYTTGDDGFELNLSGWNINGIANKTDILNNTGNGSSRANVITT